MTGDRLERWLDARAAEDERAQLAQKIFDVESSATVKALSYEIYKLAPALQKADTDMLARALVEQGWHR